MKTISGKDLAKLLEKNGWVLRRVKGSHHIFAKTGHTVRISVPIHGNSPLKIGLLKHLLRAAGIEETEL